MNVWFEGTEDNYLKNLGQK